MEIATAADRLARGPCTVHALEVVHGDDRRARAEQFGDRTADSGAAAGDERTLSREIGHQPDSLCDFRRGKRRRRDERERQRLGAGAAGEEQKKQGRLHARIGRITFPETSVRRKSRPLKR